MKKKVLLIGLFLIAVVAVSFQSYLEKNKLGDLILENIDALASDDEWGEIVECWGSGSVLSLINI